MKIFFCGEPSEMLLCMKSLSECLGASAELVRVEEPHSLFHSLHEPNFCGGTVVLDVASLAELFTSEDARELSAQILDRSLSTLCLVSSDDAPSARFLKLVTDGGIQGIRRVASAERVSFVSAAGASGELAGFSYPRSRGEAICLLVESQPAVEALMQLDGVPNLVSVRAATGKLFIWSTPRIFDVHRPLSAEKEFEEAVEEYVPAIVFLRAALGEQCWHNPDVSAGIVIDDPLLRKNYGFINFPKLLESARKHGYHITLAFIPWNHWRSRFKQVQMFRGYSDCFSICAHGCDHTANEFRSTDYDVLLHRNFVARQRMERHRERTGLANEPLMVCPQEQYSLEAMRAFADSRQFVGLICTACMPRNLSSPQICGADLLLPAQDSFYGFPVFKRHYWNGMAVFAMSLFLGKPAVLVEHHEFFRNGSVGAEGFAEGLAELKPELKWKSLAEIVMRTHARRRVSNNREQVRFFTDTFYLEHQCEESVDLKLIRRVPETTHVKRVCIGSREVPFNREDGFLTFETQLQRPETLTVQVDVAPIKPTKCYSPGVRYQASVALRRGLSEFRDNTIARNRTALRTGRRLMELLKQTAS
jgi:hypothetical protein